MPSSKKPTAGAGGDASLRTASTSRCRNATSIPSRSSAGADRRRAGRSSASASAAPSVSTAVASRSSSSGGRLSTASANTGQSMAITTAVAGSWRTSRSSARSPCCGVNQPPPNAERCRVMRSRCSSASPRPDHAPQAIAWPGRPRARRCAASWSRKALAAAWLACPALPMVPTMLENSRNRSSSRCSVARCRCHAPSIFGHSTRSNVSQLWLPRAASASTPTLWMTPPSGGRSRSMRASMASTASASVTSASSTCIRTPRSRSAAIASEAAGSGARRPLSTIASAPRSASQPATAQPIPPMPPVTRYVRPGRSRPPASGEAARTILPRWRAARMHFIAGPASVSGHLLYVSGRSSPAATRSMTRRSASPGTAGSCSLSTSSFRMV